MGNPECKSCTYYDKRSGFCGFCMVKILKEIEEREEVSSDGNGQSNDEGTDETVRERV